MEDSLYRILARGPPTLLGDPKPSVKPFSETSLWKRGRLGHIQAVLPRIRELEVFLY